MSHRGAAALLCVAACLTLSPYALATLLVPLDLDELVATADVVVIGRVAHATPQRATGGGVETAVMMSGLTVLKGLPATSVTFTVPGGRVGRYRTVVPGAPALAPGDEAVVFLRETLPGRLMLAGFSQGFIPVARDRVTSEATVMAPAGRQVVDVRVVRGDPVRRPVSLSSFAREIRDRVEREASAREKNRIGDRRRGKGRPDGAPW